MSVPILLRVRSPLPSFTVDVEVAAASGRLALFGPSGAGKTTILKALAGLASAAPMRLALGDNVVVETSGQFTPKAHERRIGFVFQDHRLFPHLSVADNIAYGATAGSPTIQNSIDVAEVEGLLTRSVGDLSGGERRRVALARALAMDPALLLLDEPYNGLDRKGATALRHRLADHLQRCGIPFVLVTHTLDDVLAHDCHVALIDQGKITGQGPADEVFASEAGVHALSFDDAALRAGPLSIFRVTATLQDNVTGLLACKLANGARLLVPHNAGETENAFVKIAASDVSIALDAPARSSILNILPATVADVERIDDTALIDLDLGAALVLKARITAYSLGELGIARGQKVFAQIKSAALVS